MEPIPSGETRTYRVARSGGSVWWVVALGGLAVAAGVAWARRPPNARPPSLAVVAGLVVATVALAAVLYADVRQRARRGIEIAGHGFRTTAPDADWIPWSAVADVTLQRIRQRIVLWDADGRRLHAVGLDVEDVAEALGRVLEACPDAVRPWPLPATFRPPAAYRWFMAGLGAIPLVGLTTLVFFLVRPLGARRLGAALGTAVPLAAALAMAVVVVAVGVLLVRGKVWATTIDATGITVRQGANEWRIERAAIRWIGLTIAWHATGESGAYVVDVQVDDGGEEPRTISPPSVDALAMLATAREMWGGASDRG